MYVLRLFIFILFFCIGFVSNAEESNYPACKNVTGNHNMFSDHKGHDCSSRSGNFKQLQEVMRSTDQEHKNSSGDLVQMLRAQLKTEVTAKHDAMKMLKACIIMTEMKQSFVKEDCGYVYCSRTIVTKQNALNELGYKNEFQLRSIMPMCPGVVKTFREKINKNFKIMEHNLLLGKAIGNFSSRNTDVRYKYYSGALNLDALPITQESNAHIGNTGFQENMPKLSEAKVEEYNNRMFQKMLSTLNQPVNYKDNPETPEDESKYTVLDTFQYKFKSAGGKMVTVRITPELLKKKLSGKSYSKKVKILKKLLTTFDNANGKRNFSKYWTKNVSGPHLDKYYKAMSSTPVISQLKSANPSTSELLLAMDPYLNESNHFIDKLTPGTDENKEFDLMSLHYLKNNTNSFLEKNPQYCSAAAKFDKEVSIEKQRRKSRDNLILGATVAGCALGFMSGVGATMAAVACTAGGAATGVKTVKDSWNDRNYKLALTKLNAVEGFIGADFESLNQAEKKMYADFGFALLGLVPVGTGAGQLASKAMSRNVNASRSRVANLTHQQIEDDLAYGIVKEGLSRRIRNIPQTIKSVPAKPHGALKTYLPGYAVTSSHLNNFRVTASETLRLGKGYRKVKRLAIGTSSTGQVIRFSAIVWGDDGYMYAKETFEAADKIIDPVMDVAKKVATTAGNYASEYTNGIIEKHTRYNCLGESWEKTKSVSDLCYEVSSSKVDNQDNVYIKGINLEMSEVRGLIANKGLSDKDKAQLLFDKHRLYSEYPIGGSFSNDNKKRIETTNDFLADQIFSEIKKLAHEDSDFAIEYTNVYKLANEEKRKEAASKIQLFD